MSEKNKKLTKIVEEEIIEFIKKNHLEPGDKLKNEYELAELLEVGRGTIREAIKSLVSRNILEVRQGAGTFVSSGNGIPEDPLGLTMMEDDENLALDTLAVRLLLEPEIAAMTAHKITDEQLQELEEQCLLVEKLLMEGRDYKEEDARFHRKIGEFSGNRMIRNLVSVITSSVYLNVGGTKARFKEQTVVEHRSILDALKRRDGAGAKYAMIAHLNTSREGLLNRVGETGDGTSAE